MHGNALRSFVLAAGFGTLAAIGGAPATATAADLSLHASKRVAVHVRHHRVSRAVYDYDGSAVVFRPYRSVRAPAPDGATVVRTEYAAVPAPRAYPWRYLNGQPVLPQHPRGWPVTATLRFRMMANLP